MSSNAYTLISQDYPNTYVSFFSDDGTTIGNALSGITILPLTRTNIPFKILYGQGGGTYKTTGFCYKNI